jgi:glycosyltransferase involved in cell wall biosynthesis
MDMWLRGLGISSGLLLNFVPQIPVGPSTPPRGGPHLGLWLAAESYRKLPYAMIAAAGMIEGAVLAGSGVSERALEFARFVGLDTTALLTSTLDREDLLVALGRTHVNLYVTQSEGGPLQPLESLAAGTPCLIGPASHIFADDDYLAGALIVPYPDHAEVIARFARNAIDNRDEIVAAYREYAPGYNARAHQSVELFLA